MKLSNVLLTLQGHIAVLTVNRPKALNALNTDTLLEIGSVIDDISGNNDIYAVIITGAGEKAFVAGADISDMVGMSVLEARKFGMLGSKTFRKIETMEKPVIAAINGYALGGGLELAMACDIRLASSTAKFGQPEVGLGIIPGFGGTIRLSRLIGQGMAKELILTAKTIDAEEALRIGLINRIVQPVALMDAAMELAESICRQAPIAVRLAKASINRGVQGDIDTALMYETELFGECFSTVDQK
jgi:enoyl-CoA hydratase